MRHTSIRIQCEVKDCPVTAVIPVKTTDDFDMLIELTLLRGWSTRVSPIAQPTKTISFRCKKHPVGIVSV